ncbi:MAG: TIGR00730 family Rossman fold protein, partial [Myxococcaceae bacterium]
MNLESLCVFCGSRPGTLPAYVEAAQSLGKALAARNLRLIYGGGRVGLMGALADATLAAGGLVTGVMPSPLGDREYTHDGLTELHRVDTMHQRKAMMEQLADGFIALPGGFGTFEELFEMITWWQLGIHRKPIGLLDVDGFFAPLRALVDHAIDCGFIPQTQRALLQVSSDAEELLAAMAAYAPPALPRLWITRSQS